MPGRRVGLVDAGYAVQWRGADSGGFGSGEVGLEGLQVLQAADAVGAVSEHEEPVAAVGEEVVDRHPVGGVQVKGTPLRVTLAGLTAPSIGSVAQAAFPGALATALSQV